MQENSASDVLPSSVGGLAGSMRIVRTAPAFAGALVGAGLTLGGWMLLVPWDLSEVDAVGNPTSTGGDDAWPAIIGVFFVVAVIGILAARFSQQGFAMAFTLVGAGTWTALFAWRVSTARTTGANMWMIPFLVLVVPAVVGVSAVTYAISRRWGTST